MYQCLRVAANAVGRPVIPLVIKLTTSCMLIVDTGMRSIPMLSRVTCTWNIVTLSTYLTNFEWPDTNTLRLVLPRVQLIIVWQTVDRNTEWELILYSALEQHDIRYRWYTDLVHIASDILTRCGAVNLSYIYSFGSSPGKWVRSFTYNIIDIITDLCCMLKIISTILESMSLYDATLMAC